MSRLDLRRIKATLESVAAGAVSGAGRGRIEREPLDAPMVANLLAGYSYAWQLVHSAIDVFAMGHHRHLLELNSLVLCGTDARRRHEYARHLAATERRFYEEPHAGVEDLVDWMRIHGDLPLWERAAGVYLRLLGKPQLFIEGNHRTGVLVMSYVLIREGYPPFVLSSTNAEPYFELSAAVRDIRKSSVAALIRVPRLRRRFARILMEHSDPKFLLAQDLAPRGNGGPVETHFPQ